MTSTDTPNPSTDTALLLIHGLGATNGVWADLRAVVDWSGPVIAPDLPGHGSAPWSGDYTVGALAAAVSEHCADRQPVVAVGHSLGGVVALALASGRFRPSVRAVLGVGMKVAWTDDDVTGMVKVAAKGIRWFDTRDEAVDRFLVQAGLAGVADPDHPAVDAAVVEEEGRWRVAQDPRTFAQQAVDMAGLMADTRCPVVLGAGEHDPMCSRSDLAPYVEQPRIAAERGHNVQVEDPDWLAGLIDEVVAGSR